MKSINKSVLTLGVLAFGGMIALTAPASAGDYDNHGADALPGTVIKLNPSLVIVPDPYQTSYDDNHGSNYRVEVANQGPKQVRQESVAQRRARIAAEAEAKRLQQ